MEKKEETEETEETRPESMKTVLLFSMFGFLSYTLFSVTVSSAEEILTGHTGYSGSTSAIWFSLSITTIIFPPIITYIFDRLPPLVFILVLFPINAGALACLLLAGTRLWLKYLGVCLIGSGFSIADVTGLSLTAYFHKTTVTAYCIGTGIAYVFGPLYITATTSWIHLSYKIALSAVFIVQPFIYLLCYCLLDKRRENTRMGYREISDEDPNKAKLPVDLHQYLTLSEKLRTVLDIFPLVFQIAFGILSHDFVLSGITTTLAFSNSPFSPADHYKYYLIVSFLGLFIGRSYLGLVDYIRPGLSDKIHLRHTWLLGVISALHVIVLILASLYRFLPNVWCVLVLVFTLGVFAEATFANISLMLGEIQDERKREFAMGVAILGVYLGAAIGAGVAVPVEKLLVEHCLSFTNETSTCFTRE